MSLVNQQRPGIEYLLLYQKVVKKLLKYKNDLKNKKALYVDVPGLPEAFQPLNTHNINKLLRHLDRKIVKFAYNKPNRHLLEIVELPEWLNVRKLVGKTRLTLRYLNSKPLKGTILKIVSLVVKVEKLSSKGTIDLSKSKIVDLKFKGNSLELYQYLNGLLPVKEKIEFDYALVSDWALVCEKINS